MFWMWLLNLLWRCHGAHGQMEAADGLKRRDMMRQFDHPWTRDLELDVSQLSEKHPPFGVCWNALSEASTNKIEVTKSDYLVFLNILTRGQMNEMSFKELEFVQVTIFYAAACTRNCQGENAGSIELASSGEGLGVIVALCYSVMRELTTTATVSFGAGVEFDPLIVPQEAIGSCLGLATQAALWDAFGCDKLSRRRLGSSASLPSFSSIQTTFSSKQPILPKKRRRRLGTLPECHFDVTVTDVSSLLFPCPSPRENLLCGDVYLDVIVGTSQLERPLYNDFIDEVTGILEQTVKDRTIMDFFPEECT